MNVGEGPQNQINFNNNNENAYINNNSLKTNLKSLNDEFDKISSSNILLKKQDSESGEDNLKKSFLNEFGLREKKFVKTFDFNQFISKKSCTSYYFGDEPYYQKAYICTICDPKKKNYICNFCHKYCHKKCRETLKEIPKSLVQKESLDFKYFACYCGSFIKHTFEVKEKRELVSCNMIELDSMLGIDPYHCYVHDVTICCICAVVCHTECKPEKEKNFNRNFTCNCQSDNHSNFNELALSFPLEKYKKVSNIDVWPVQILNILFNKKKTFNKMTQFISKFFSTDIDINSQKNDAFVNKLKSLLELFSDTFNRKFKTYYYDNEIIQTFEYEKLFSLIQHIEVTNEETTIIKFRLIFILLFIHLRKDFRIIKSLTSNDFMCNSVLDRLIYKKMLKSKTILTDKINEKYKIREIFPLKKFALNELYNLMTKGMYYISVEENQDEFEIGLKLICFMLKHLMFNKEDLILLIDSLALFHEKFYEYILKEKNNIYLLLDIFNAIVEICYMIAVNYNDIIIENYLDKNDSTLDKFIHVRNDHSVKLLSMVFKNCEVLIKHFKLLVKPGLDNKTDEEKKREKHRRKHLIAMKEKILSQTTGVSIKMPDNGGLFTDKIINLCIETLSIFCLADNIYQKQLGFIEDKDFEDYFEMCKVIEIQGYRNYLEEVKGEHILYNLKLGLEEVYKNLFTSSYIKEENQLYIKLKQEVLTACDKIKNRMDIICKDPNIINKINEQQINDVNTDLNDIELIRRDILNDISQNISFAKSPILLIEEGRENFVNSLIISQVDESIFKGFFFLTNIHFPNIINQDIVKILLDFLSLYFLTKRGIVYFLTGKNIQVIHRLINRFRFDDKNKNINEQKKRTEKFIVHSIKAVIHFLCVLTKFIRILKIKSIIKHKSLFKFKKSILTHLHNFVYHIKTPEQFTEYKLQLKEGLEIFNNLHGVFDYAQYKEIKSTIIKLFIENPYHFLDPKLFQQWFDKNKININDMNLMRQRKKELDYYFEFFEIMTRNSFFVYKNDERGKNEVETLIKFIDLENLSTLLINNPDLITLKQKTILLKFIRTFYLMDYLDQINILKKSSLLTTKQYKSMLKNNVINNKRFNNNINSNNYNANNNNNYYNQNSGKNVNYINNNSLNYDNENIDNNIINNNNSNINNINNININKYVKNKDLYINKLNYIDKLIILINFYIKEIKDFPTTIHFESKYNLKSYIAELIFATQDICSKIYYNKDALNKILPYYYKLILQFILKKSTFIKILQDIEVESKMEIAKYNNLLDNINDNKEYKSIINRNFDVFNKEELYRYIIKSIFDIFKETKINEEYCLKKYLEKYDVFNEANFPPFSLLEVYDYEYFYEWPEKGGEEKILENNITDQYNKNNLEKLKNIRESYLEDFRIISKTAFLDVLTVESINTKIDFGEKYVCLFRSFINSTELHNFENFKSFLCIMTKILFYGGENIQKLFNDMVYDKYFFNNLNRELNYNIVLFINLSQKYELCEICSEITDITKLTIQFLQLLGEGFNLTFHNNILKGETKSREIKKDKNEGKYNKDMYDDINEVIKDEDSYSSSSLNEENEISLSHNNDNEEKIKIKNNKKIPLIEPRYTIYQTAIYNLKRIFHLMELNNLLEGEAGFDKLCVLSTNIIDFLIEYVDTSSDLTYIIDKNFQDLFFGTEKNYKIRNLSDMNKIGIISIYTMKINESYDTDNEEDFERYKLRKIMIAYMKIKYFQLLKAYLQIGNKKEFVKLLLNAHLGPIQLYEEILYYMKELINNLVHKDYDKYNHLLVIDNVKSYKDKLKELYMFEDEFRTSVEISVIFQICIIIATLEEIYKITMLKDHFEKEIPIEKDDNMADIQIDNEINDLTNIKIQNNDFNKYNNNNNNIYNNNINITNNYNINNINSHPINKGAQNINQKVNLINNNNFHTKNDNNREIEGSDIFLIDNTNKTLFNRVINNSSQNERQRTLYDNIRLNYQRNKQRTLQRENMLNIPPKKRKKLEESNTTFNSKFSLAVYKFLSSLISKVEIKMDDDEDENSNSSEEKSRHMNSLTNEISTKIIEHKNEDLILANLNYGNNLDNNIDNDMDEKDNILEKNDSKEDNMTKKYVFFIKPYVAFHLSQQTKEYFLHHVDRKKATNKYKELIKYSDYFLFEMMYNMKYIKRSNFSKSLSKISFYHLQIINYLLILAENALLMYHYYRDYSLSNTEYYIELHPEKYDRFIDIVIIILVKLFIIIFSALVWFYYKFIITYERNVLIQEEKDFIFKGNDPNNQNIIHPDIVKYFREKGNLFSTLNLINKDIGYFKKIKIAVIDSVILNIDVDVFVFSFILDILFLTTGHPISLAIETLLIYGLFPFLLNILRAFTEKFSSLLSCLLFTYFIIYVYNYITIFYVRDVFDLGDIFHYDSETYIKEPFCYSALQCFLVLINYGTRSGGGIGDMIPKISYKHDTKMFVGRFIYDMTFFIIIIMIMGNVTFGLVVDTFGALRDENYQYEKDRKNNCFICQIDRDGCLLKNKDYENHIKKDHNLWSYVNFLIYLHLYNANDFTRIEGSVWEKIPKKDYGWFPIDSDAGKHDDEDD